jgi:hypothetical protein
LKQQIDRLYLAILATHRHQPPACPELATVLQLLTLDRKSEVARLRRVLACWALDPALSTENRDYAAQRLRELPPL